MKAALYARVSSEKQDVDLSISAQLKALREYAPRNGYEVIQEYVDEAESGKTSARPKFKEMIFAARRNPRPFDAILVWKYSRFARNREDSIVFKTMLRKNGVKVISINEPFEDTPTGKLMEAMVESLDEFYSANLSEEVTRGMRESASRGFYVCSSAPYGYSRIKVSDGNKQRIKLEPEPNQSKVVERIFDGVLQGKGSVEIAKELNKDGIASPRGKQWAKTTINHMLTNKVYTGTLIWSQTSGKNLAPIKVENAWPAIVDQEKFNRVQEMFKQRAPKITHPRRVDSKYLLSGIAKCGHCGKAMVGQDAKSGKFSYYVCGTLSHKGAGSCSARYLNSQQFERAVVDKIKERILTRENLIELVRLINDELDSTSNEYHNRLEVLNNEIADVSNRLERLYDAVETGHLSLGDLAPRIQQLRKRQEQLSIAKIEIEQKLSDRRVELADMKTVTKYVEDLHDLLNGGSIAEKKTFLRSFVKEAKVTGTEVLLTYTIPMTPNKLTEEKISVLPIEHLSGPGRYRTYDQSVMSRPLYH
jgi:site-specific DNA recombinase